MSLKMKSNIIKLGGSVISESESESHFNAGNTERLAKELYPFQKGLILIHGTGHVGKPPAIKYGYVKNGIISKEDRLIALMIKSKIQQLNQDVVNTFLSCSIPAIPVNILHFYNESDEQFIIGFIETVITELVMNGMVPVF